MNATRIGAQLHVGRLIELAAAVDIDTVLQPMMTPRARPQIEEWPLEPFPPLKRPLQQQHDWWKRRGQPHGTPTHRMLYAVAEMFRPWLVGVIGVGTGLPAQALAAGARASGMTDVTINGYDDEIANPGCLEWVRECFMAQRIAYNLSHSSTKQYESLPLSGQDLFLLDWNLYPEPAAIEHDLQLVVRTLNNRGMILVAFITPAGAEFLRQTKAIQHHTVVELPGDVAVIGHRSLVQRGV
jgi:hypothetical protein